MIPSVHSLDLQPGTHKLRQFSWAGATVLALAGLLHALSSGSLNGAWIYWSIGALLLIGGLGAPSLLRWPYIILSLLVFPIGFILSQLILALIFYGLFAPLALWFRMIGRDALHQKWDPERKSPKSYWIERSDTRPPEDYYRQF